MSTSPDFFITDPTLFSEVTGFQVSMTKTDKEGMASGKAQWTDHNGTNFCCGMFKEDSFSRLGIELIMP